MKKRSVQRIGLVVALTVSSAVFFAARLVAQDRRMGGIGTILPMAIVMIAGPQIISAVFLATSEGWRRNSLAYIGGAALSITLFVLVAYFSTKLLKSATGGSNAR